MWAPPTGSTPAGHEGLPELSIEATCPVFEAGSRGLGLEGRVLRAEIVEATYALREERHSSSATGGGRDT
jgi:hypothetical protein